MASRPPLYRIGDIVGNVKILRIVQNSTAVKKQIFLVEFQCCGAIDYIMGAALQKRIAKRSSKCKSCASKANLESTPTHTRSREIEAEGPGDYGCEEANEALAIMNKSLRDSCK